MSHGQFVSVRRRIASASLFFSIFGALTSTSGASAAAIDQAVRVDFEPGGIYAVHNVAVDFAWAQTFTVGVTGTLTAIDVQIDRPNDQPIFPLLLDVRPTTAGGAPVPSDAAALAAATLPYTAFPLHPHSYVQPDYTPFTLPGSGVSVTEGDVLAIVLRKAGPDPIVAGYNWATSPPGTNPYPHGEAFFRADGSDAFFSQDTYPTTITDSGFRTHVVPVPEPATILGIAVLTGVTTLRRRGRRTRR